MKRTTWPLSKSRKLLNERLAALRRKRFKPPRMPLTQKPVVYLDTETTGLDPERNEIIELAFIMERHEGAWWPDIEIIRRLEAFAILGEPHSHFASEPDRLEFCTRIKPQHIETAHPKALEVNGYTASGWSKAPVLCQTFAEVLAAIFKNTIFVGHNVSFDHDMLSAAIRKAGVRSRFSYHKIDTVTLAYEHLGHCIESLSLDDLCPILGVSNENAHTALADVKRCRAVYQALTRATAEQRAQWAG